MQNILTTSPLLWAGLLAGMVMLPILIHLINRLRHKRVRWAAMDFLLASHKKNRNWVWLKQLLLLLARIAALVLILMTIGQVGCNDDSMARFLGGNVTHHYILIDDSLSMSENNSGVTPLDRAGEAATMIGKRIFGRDNQRVTLLRFSQAVDFVRSRELSGIDSDPEESESQLLSSMSDLNSMIVDRDFERKLADVIDGVQSKHLAIAPEPSVELVGQLIQQRSSENAIVYVLSDFRKGDWANPDSLKQPFGMLESTGAAIDLIRCADEPGTNLSIVSLEPEGSVRVAGIPMMMRVQVKNYGEEPVRKVQVNLQAATYPDETTESNSAETTQPDLDDLPAILIEEIPAGESVTRRFPVYFQKPGQQAVRASLQPDVLSADDAAWVVTSVSSAEKVLVVEDPSGNAGRFISIAMAPNGMTGLQVDKVGKAALRDRDAEQLAEYEAIFLLDIDRLEDASIQHLQQYAENGGGVVFFTGPNTNFIYYTESLYANGNGVFPLPLQRAISVTEQLEDQSADITPVRHPVFASVLDVDYSPLDLVQVKRICQPPLEWSAEVDHSVEVIATVRDDDRMPLVIEKSVGSGTVIAVLTTASGEWNNWLRNPTFPTTLLLLQDYVARGSNVSRRLLTGSSRTISLPSKDYRPELQFVAPINTKNGFGFDRNPWKVKAASKTTDSQPTTIGLGALPNETDVPGIYEVWKQTNQSETQLERFALNVDNRESDLQLASRAEIVGAAGNVNVVNWKNFGPGATNNRGTSLVRVLLILLLAGLLIEQWLAWSASYHPRSTGKGNESKMGRRGLVKSGRSKAA